MRLQLTLALLAATASLADTAPANAQESESRVATEVAAYQDSLAVSVLTPSVSGVTRSATSGWGATAHYLVDVVSAASPDIVSTASRRWTEVRHAGNIGASYKPETFGVAANASISSTPDYLALGGSGRLTQELDEKNLILLGGYGYGHDTIGRTGTAFSVFSRALDYHTLSAGITRVLNPSMVLGVLGETTIERGDQSKPYRYVPVFAADVAPTIARGASVDAVTAAALPVRPIEQLPLGRERYSLSLRFSWRMASSTIRVDERGYADSWELHATTTDLKWFFDLGPRVIVWPHARVHAQSGVSFWRRAYIARNVHDLPAVRTGDRELGPLTSGGLGGGIRFALGPEGHLDDWVLTGTVEGTYTSFLNALYVTERYAGLATVGLEVGF